MGAAVSEWRRIRFRAQCGAIWRHMHTRTPFTTFPPPPRPSLLSKVFKIYVLAAQRAKVPKLPSLPKSVSAPGRETAAWNRLPERSVASSEMILLKAWTGKEDEGGRGGQHTEVS